jgi:hypothetical protein
MDSTIINVFEYCKTKSNQRINDRYRTLKKNTKQDIYNLEYCKCLEKQYTNCLKKLNKTQDGVSGCQSIVDEYAVVKD